MTKHFDIVVIGAGNVGLSCAAILAKLGLKIAIVDKGTVLPRSESKPKTASRLLAITDRSCKIFADHDLLGELRSNSQDINFIRVVEGDSTAYMDLDPQELGLDNFGCMTPENIVSNMLIKQVLENPDIEIIRKTDVMGIAQQADNNVLTVLDADGKNNKISAKLIVAADGRSSTIRDLLGIEEYKHDYHQVGIVCDIGHEEDHCGSAVEKFYPSGAFAILPQKGGFSSSIVWTDEQALGKALSELTEEQLTMAIQVRFGDYLGKIRILSEVKAFNLEMKYAKCCIAKRVVLIGDAAHAIHPVTGQGFNLGLRDVHALSELIQRNLSIGLDIGSYTMLKEYEAERLGDSMFMSQATHSINILFSNSFLPVKVFRKLGLRIANKIPIMRKAFMKYGLGLLGDVQQDEHG